MRLFVWKRAEIKRERNHWQRVPRVWAEGRRRMSTAITYNHGIQDLDTNSSPNIKGENKIRMIIMNQLGRLYERLALWDKSLDPTHIIILLPTSSMSSLTVYSTLNHAPSSFARKFFPSPSKSMPNNEDKKPKQCVSNKCYEIFWPR